MLAISYVEGLGSMIRMFSIMVSNKYSMVHKGKKVTLTPMSRSEVCEDQIKNESEKRTRD